MIECSHCHRELQAQEAIIVPDNSSGAMIAMHGTCYRAVNPPKAEELRRISDHMSRLHEQIGADMDRVRVVDNSPPS